MSSDEQGETGSYDFFLSYRGADILLASRMRDALLAEGYRVFMQKHDIPVGGNFLERISVGLEASRMVIALLTANYFDSNYTNDEFWAAYKLGKLIIARVGRTRIPELLTHNVYQDIRPESDDAEFTAAMRSLAQRKPHPFKSVRYVQNVVDGGHGFSVAADDFVGREDDLTMLDRAWNSGGRQRVVTIIADGGFGKTTMVREWMIRQAASGVQRANLFAYSFENQSRSESNTSDAATSSGSAAEGSNISADSTPFLKKALTLLSPNDPAVVAMSGPRELCDNLNHFLSDHPTIIFLDGLEPMQVQRGSTDYGTVPNSFLKEFITGFPSHDKCLLIITSRVPVTNLGRAGGNPAVVQHELKSLSETEAVAMLRKIKGFGLSKEDCLRFARAVDCHPLTLSIYGQALVNQKVTKLENFQLYKDLVMPGKKETDPGKKAAERIRKFLRSVIPGLEPTVANKSKVDEHQLEMTDRSVLFSISLFDYPPTLRQLCLFFDQGPVPEVSDALFNRLGPFGLRSRFSENKLEESLDRLRDRRLLRDTDPDSKNRLKLDPATFCEMHPLVHHGVREIFESLGKVEHATPAQQKAWKRANWQMYLAITRSVKPTQPEKREELLTLYSAVPFGVRAGEGLKAGWMYGRRCLRGFRAYSTNQHGLIYSDLEALSYYFADGWRSVVREDIGLNSYAKAQARVWAGILLCGTNNYEAGKPLMEEGIEAARKTRNFVTAARNARNLSNACVLHGDLESALKFARAALEYPAAPFEHASIPRCLKKSSTKAFRRATGMTGTRCTA